MSSSAHTPRFLGRAWSLLLARGLVCALFGLTTTFWATPDDTAMHVMVAVYMLLLGLVNWRISAAVRDRRVLAYALTIALFGVIVLVAPSRAMFAMVAALGFTLFGLMEASVCWMSRRSHPVVRDGVIIGLAMAGSGIILPLVQDLGPHGMLGVLGGGAIICAVVMLIGALTVRHETVSGSLPA
ncbi:hypothetical protein GCM10011512_02830 [Tersicoccus solisilvae]|uniref:Major facilitator superfamily (MFS) profile domain-containing protein n=1 Tax=Tersicoccus solisilvae TaxID=1882339 RepID=A0ABQ1NNB1_9MICC|nr:hypothetical protein [Tersicoccus solisilvae]GGC79671.1 hypothetical protein GCM10011512_02830 [Tersicoccus solisilvae]